MSNFDMRRKDAMIIVQSHPQPVLTVDPVAGFGKPVIANFVLYYIDRDVKKV